MINLEDIDNTGYVESILPKNYPPTMLFIYYEALSRKLVTTYTSPINIIRYFWKEHTKYSDDGDYSDVASYLVSRINQMELTLPMKYLMGMVDQNTRDMVDVNNLAFLFLTNISVITENITFGYVHIPQQKYLLSTFLNGLHLLIDIKNTTESIIQDTLQRDYLVKKLR